MTHDLAPKLSAEKSWNPTSEFFLVLTKISMKLSRPSCLLGYTLVKRNHNYHKSKKIIYRIKSNLPVALLSELLILLSSNHHKLKQSFHQKALLNNDLGLF